MLWNERLPRFVRGVLAALLALMMSGLSIGVLASETQSRLPSGNEGLTLTLGVPPGEANEATMVAAAEAKKQGLEVQVAEFNDPELWHLNMHAAFFTIDANFFQSEPELRFFNKGSGGRYIEEHATPLVERGKPQADKVRLVSVGYGYSIPMGVYSKKLKHGDAIPPSTTIAVPSGPVDMGRALLLLQAMGLIKLRSGVGDMATLSDVVENPKQIKVIPVKDEQSVSVFDKATASVTYPNIAKRAGIAEKDALALDNTDPEIVKRHAIRFVARADVANDSRLQTFIKIYQSSPEVQAALRRAYGSLVAFPW